jgi:hypothetical protein
VAARGTPGPPASAPATYGGGILAEVVYTESGKQSTGPNWPTPWRSDRGHRATLLIAKLDRLARNVHFISGLMETGVPFVAADMPTALVHAAHLRGHGSNAAVPAGPILHTIQFGVGTTIGGALMRRLGFLTRVPDRWQSQTLCP